MSPINRRDFLRMGCCGMAVGAAASFSRFGVMNAYAQTQTDYKALVCVFLNGGNDANNMIVPVDNAGYAAYSKARAGLALAQGSLLQIHPTSASTPLDSMPSFRKCRHSSTKNTSPSWPT